MQQCTVNQHTITGETHILIKNMIIMWVQQKKAASTSFPLSVTSEGKASLFVFLRLFSFSSSQNRKLTSAAQCHPLISTETPFTSPRLIKVYKNPFKMNFSSHIATHVYDAGFFTFQLFCFSAAVPQLLRNNFVALEHGIRHKNKCYSFVSRLQSVAMTTIFRCFEMRQMPPNCAKAT